MIHNADTIDEAVSALFTAAHVDVYELALLTMLSQECKAVKQSNEIIAYAKAVDDRKEASFFARRGNEW
jgi:hypothetical protein